jgi:hypothetical protein
MKEIVIKNILLFFTVFFICIFNSAYPQTIYGVSGLLKSPDAYVVGNGKCAVTFGYYHDEMAESSEKIVPDMPQAGASFLIGPVSRIEVSLRIAAFIEAPKITFNPRNFGIDLIFNIKGVVFREKKYVPQISLGIQDIVGTWMYQSTYLVLSKTILFGKNSHIAGTLGYGSEILGYLSENVQGKSPRDYRFIGIFGSLEGQLFSFVSLLADYDAEDWNLGLKLNYKEIVCGKFFVTEFKYPGVMLSVKFNL